MNIRLFAFLTTLLFAGACSEKLGTDELRPDPDGKIKVVIGAMQDGTRTSLGDDGRTTQWVVGDQIAVWAAGGEGYALTGETFSLYTFNSHYGSADFSATIIPLTAGTYTYYATYPKPASVSGTTATYTLPTAQNGTYEGAADIMACTPVTGPELAGNPRDELALSFQHLLHMVRIEIPTGRNLFGQPVKRLEIEFPAEVTGTVTFDVTDPANTLQVTGGSRTITLDFDGAGTEGGDAVYAYAFVRPCDLDGQVVFRAYNATGYASKDVRTTLRKTMAAGRVTPIKLTVPAPRPITNLDFKVAVNNLGETPTNIALTAPEGMGFVAPFTLAGSANASAPRNASGLYVTEVYSDIYPAANIAGKTLLIDYESENALLQGRSITLPAQITDSGRTEVAMTVPYLYFEDFSALTATGTRDMDTKDLSGDGVPGWIAGNRSSYNAGLCVGIRSYSNLGGPFHGRTNSGELSCIKNGKSVNIKLVYNSDWKKNKSSSMSVNVGRTSGTGHDDAIEGGRTVSLSNNSSASPSNIPTQHEVAVTGCTRSHRIAWKSSGQNGTWFNYDDVYIDNIRIQIAQ